MHFFCAFLDRRFITNVWNSLPFSVVTAPSVNSFKNRLDKHWALQELKYDWETELSGTGSRSRVEFWVLRVYHYMFQITIWAQKHFAYAHNIRYVMLCYVHDRSCYVAGFRPFLVWVVLVMFIIYMLDNLLFWQPNNARTASAKSNNV